MSEINGNGLRASIIVPRYITKVKIGTKTKFDIGVKIEKVPNAFVIIGNVKRNTNVVVISETITSLIAFILTTLLSFTLLINLKAIKHPSNARKDKLSEVENII